MGNHKSINTFFILCQEQIGCLPRRFLSIWISSHHSAASLSNLLNANCTFSSSQIFQKLKYFSKPRSQSIMMEIYVSVELTHIYISIKEWNFLIVRSASFNILIIVVVKWFPSKKSSDLLLNFTYNLLTLFKKLLILITSLFTKLEKLNPSEDCVVNVVAIVIVVVVTVSPVSHQTKVCQDSDTNW